MLEEDMWWKTPFPGEAAWGPGLYAGLCLAGILIIVAAGIRLFLRPPDWRGSIARLTQRAWTARDVGTVGLALLNLQLVMLVLSAWLGNVSELFWLVMNSLAFHVAALVLIVGFVRTRRMSWRTAFGMEAAHMARSVRSGVLFYLAILPVLLYSSILYQAFLFVADYPTTMQPVAEMLSASHTWGVRIYLVVLSVLIAPLAEELLFRGIAVPFFGRRFGIGPAIFITSVAFAGLHMHVPSFVPLFVISLGLSLAYLHTGSLLVPIVIHALFNGINLGMLFSMN